MNIIIRKYSIIRVPVCLWPFQLSSYIFHLVKHNLNAVDSNLFCKLGTGKGLIITSLSSRSMILNQTKEPPKPSCHSSRRRSILPQPNRQHKDGRKWAQPAWNGWKEKKGISFVKEIKNFLPKKQFFNRMKKTTFH